MVEEESINCTSLDLARPFVEESETPLIVIYRFEGIYDTEQLEDIAKCMVKEIDSLDIAITSDIGINISENCYIMFKLCSTNTNKEEIDDLEFIAEKVDGYKDIILSTVPAGQISRVSN